MKKISKTLIKVKKMILLTLILGSSAPLMALGGTPPPLGLPNESTPLDGGIAVLIIGAAAFGIKKLRDNRNSEI